MNTILKTIGWAIALIVIGLIVGVLALTGLVAAAAFELFGGLFATLLLVIGLVLAIAYFAGRSRERAERT